MVAQYPSPNTVTSLISFQAGSNIHYLQPRIRGQKSNSKCMCAQERMRALEWVMHLHCKDPKTAAWRRGCQPPAHLPVPSPQTQGEAPLHSHWPLCSNRSDQNPRKDKPADYTHQRIFSFTNMNRMPRITGYLSKNK